jgi:hypothetical protein
MFIQSELVLLHHYFRGISSRWVRIVLCNLADAQTGNSGASGKLKGIDRMSDYLAKYFNESIENEMIHHAGEIQHCSA